MVLKDICRSDFLLAEPTFSLDHLINQLIGSGSSYILSLEKSGHISAYSSQLLMKLALLPHKNPICLSEIKDSITCSIFPADFPLSSLSLTDQNQLIILVETQRPCGIIEMSPALTLLVNTCIKSNSLPYQLPPHNYMDHLDLCFQSPEMIKVMHSFQRVAPLNTPALIQGEPGTGKEKAARRIHMLSPRKNQPFVKLHCGLLPEKQMLADLFGNPAGTLKNEFSYTQNGLLRQAQGGTLFLDEVDKMPYPVQVSLLDFLQDNLRYPAASKNIRTADIRILSSTTRDLSELVRQGRFHMEFYYRLNVFQIRIPPLREHMADLPLLTENYLKRFNGRYHLNLRLSKGTLEELYEYDWPGNIREFRHTMEQMVLLAKSDSIQPETFHKALQSPGKPSLRILSSGDISYKEAKNLLERQLVEQAYEIHGSTYKAAAALGLDQSTVSKLLKKYRAQNEQKGLNSNI